MAIAARSVAQGNACNPNAVEAVRPYDSNLSWPAGKDGDGGRLVQQAKLANQTLQDAITGLPSISCEDIDAFRAFCNKVVSKAVGLATDGNVAELKRLSDSALGSEFGAAVTDFIGNDPNNQAAVTRIKSALSSVLGKHMEIAGLRGGTQ